MPTWLMILLAVWGALLPIVLAAWRTFRQVVDKIDRVEQWFDEDSELGRNVGTIPQQLKIVHDDVAALKLHIPELERRVERLEEEP